MNALQITGLPKPGASKTLEFSGASASAAVGNADYTTVRICATSDCFVEFGVNPLVAANTGMFLPAGVPEYFFLAYGAKIAAIQASAAGTLYITPME